MRVCTLVIGLWHLGICTCLAVYVVATEIIKDVKDETTLDRQNDALDVGLVLVFSIFWFSITTTMIAGVVKRRSAYLLPFLCLQVIHVSFKCILLVLPKFYHMKPMERNDDKLRDRWFVFDALNLGLVIVQICCIAHIWFCYKTMGSQKKYEQLSTSSLDAEALAYQV